jgi:hypothetical protein
LLDVYSKSLSVRSGALPSACIFQPLPNFFPAHVALFATFCTLAFCFVGHEEFHFQPQGFSALFNRDKEIVRSTFMAQNVREIDFDLIKLIEILTLPI